MSSITDVITSIGRAVRGHWAVFSYREDFERLWGVDRDEDRDLAGHFRDVLALDAEGEERNIVVVWDGMPVQDQRGFVDAAGSVSPYDWAMLLSWCVYATDELQRVRLRVCIIDMRSEGIGGDGFARRSLFFLQNAFPWIQDYRVVAESSVLAFAAEDDDATMYAWRRQATPPESRSLDMLVRDLLEPGRIMTTHSEMDDIDRSDAMQWTRELWIANLLRAENRHSVANVVGPAILTAELGRKEAVASDPVLGALVTAACWAGVVPSVQVGHRRGELQRLAGFAEPCENYFDRRRSVQFVLVDDQFELGYHHVLGLAIWGDSYTGGVEKGARTPWVYRHTKDVGGKLTCYGDVEWLLEKVEGLGPITDWSRPRQFLTGECDVLLLDLRLWQDDHVRQRTMQRLVSVANIVGIGAGDINIGNALGRALDAAKAGGTSPEALALLPLLLSHIDRTLPIVLFSSTHQRIVSELVAAYPNIISSFAKPLPSSHGPEEGAATQGWHSVGALRTALNGAIDIHEGRIAWKRLCELSAIATTTDFRWRRRDGKLVDDIKVLFGDIEALRTRLGRVFQDCVLGRMLYESLAAPWETIEEGIPPGPEEATLVIELTPRGRLARALKNIRNRRVHGSLDRDSFNGHDGRRVAILQLLFLVDLLEGNCNRQNRHCEEPPRIVDGSGPAVVRDILVHWGTTPGRQTCLHATTEKVVRTAIDIKLSTSSG